MSEWVQCNLSLRPEAVERLERLKREYGWPKSRIVTEALWLFEQIPDAEYMGPVIPSVSIRHNSA